MATNEHLIHDVTCTFDNGKFILDDLPSPLPELFTARFTTPEIFTQGNTIVANGVEMVLRTPANSNASSAFFRAGTVFHCDIDFRQNRAYAWHNGQNVDHSSLTNRDAAASHPSSAIDHRGDPVDDVLDGLEAKTAAISNAGDELAVRLDDVEAAMADISHPVDSVNGKTGHVTVDLPDFPQVRDAIDAVGDALADIDIPVASVNAKTGAVVVDLPDFPQVLHALEDIEVTIAGIHTPVTSVNGKAGDVVLDLPDFPEVNTALANKAESSTVASLQAELAAKAPVASPVLTGTPTAPTPTASTNSAQIATTAYVKSQGYATRAEVTADLAGYATIASPSFTGAPTAPTPDEDDDSQRVATTEFVNAKLEGFGGLVNGPAPLPTTKNEVGQWSALTGGMYATLPEGGTYAYCLFRIRTTNGVAALYPLVGVDAGGTKTNAGSGSIAGFTWRIA